MDWDNIRIFLAIARTGQILGAARHLKLNHATVARRLGAFEKALQVKLFARRPNGCDLTEEGERLLAYAERVESAMLAAYADIGHTDLAIEGAVRVGAPDGFGVAFLAPRLGRLKARYPGLMIQLVPVPRTFSLSRREADIAITVERPAEGRLVAHNLVDYTLGLFASRAYAARHGLPRDGAELGRHRLIGYVSDLVVSPSLDYAEEFSPRWEAAFSISSALGQVEAARSGAGIGILHSFIARSIPELVPVDAAPPIRRAYWLVYHESVRQLRRVQAVAEYITRAVEAERQLFL